jgi:hypothetical protein
MTDSHYDGGHRWEQEQNYIEGHFDSKQGLVNPDRVNFSEQYRIGVRTEQLNNPTPVRFDWDKNKF